MFGWAAWDFKRFQVGPPYPQPTLPPPTPSSKKPCVPRMFAANRSNRSAFTGHLTLKEVSRRTPLQNFKVKFSVQTGDKFKFMILGTSKNSPRNGKSCLRNVEILSPEQPSQNRPWKSKSCPETSKNRPRNIKICSRTISKPFSRNGERTSPEQPRLQRNERQNQSSHTLVLH